jgi:hypothetical protein
VQMLAIPAGISSILNGADRPNSRMRALRGACSTLPWLPERALPGLPSERLASGLGSKQYFCHPKAFERLAEESHASGAGGYMAASNADLKVASR